MRIVHLLAVICQIYSEFTVREEVSVRMTAPGTQVDLIDIDRLGCERILAVLAELLVIPDIIVRLIKDGRIIRPCLEMPCIGITLLIYAVVRTNNAVLITVPLLCTLYLLFPDTRIAKLEHLAGIPIPVIEVAHNADRARIRSPYAEYKALPVLIFVRMRAQESVAHVILAFVE